VESVAPTVKAKIILVHTMKKYRRSGSKPHTFLTSALDGGERSVSRFCRFISGKEPGAWWAPARLNEDKISLTLPGFEIQTAELIASRCTDCTVLEP